MRGIDKKSWASVAGLERQREREREWLARRITTPDLQDPDDDGLNSTSTLRRARNGFTIFLSTKSHTIGLFPQPPPKVKRSASPYFWLVIDMPLLTDESIHLEAFRNLEVLLDMLLLIASTIVHFFKVTISAASAPI